MRRQRAFDATVQQLRAAAPRLVQADDSITREFARWLLLGARAEMDDAGGVLLRYGGNWQWVSGKRAAAMIEGRV